MKIAFRTQDDILYRKLQQHLDRQPVGFPPSANGADIRLLKHIFTPEEARIATCLSHTPRALDDIFRRAAGLVSTAAELEERLTAMVKKGGLKFSREKGQDLYANAPLVVGIYELQVNRLTPEFIADFKAYTSEKRYGIAFLSTKRSQMRTVPINKSITPDLPMAEYDQILNLMEIGREIPRADAIDIIRQNQEEGLVLQPSNTQKIDFLCSCCGCCCSMLSLQRDLPLPLDFWESGFKAVFNKDRCVGCGKYGEQCSTDALSLSAPLQIGKKLRSAPVIDDSRCIGCGQCVVACKTGALKLVPRSSDRIPPPKDREQLNSQLLEDKKDPLAPVKVVVKLAGGILTKRDIRLLKS